jgi:anti-anti-sigma factor
MRNNGNFDERRLDIILESRVESADRAESLINEYCKKEYGEQERHEISLAVREAMANAMLHGNQFDASKRVFLSAEWGSLGLVISIRDEGTGCEPEGVPDPLASDNILRESGRGMLLIRTFMDEVTWRRAPVGGMELIMSKHLAKHKARTREESQMNLTASNRQVADVTVVDLSGRLVLGDESQIFRQTLKNLAGQGRKKVLLNLAGVSYIDSSGLGALVGGYTTFASHHGQVKLLNLTKTIHDLLRITKLLTVLEVHNDEAAAVRSFR